LLVVIRIGGAMVRVFVSGAVDRGFHKIVNTVAIPHIDIPYHTNTPTRQSQGHTYRHLSNNKDSYLYSPSSAEQSLNGIHYRYSSVLAICKLLAGMGGHA
jgi:hypothetical protein